MLQVLTHTTVNVDRLEHAFRTTPLLSMLPPVGDSLDVVVVRPKRDPSFLQENDEGRSVFARKIWTVLRAAYQDGAHIDLRYEENGDIVSEGNGPAVVEYFRCGGWEWEPVRSCTEVTDLLD
jgi:hypothetical protein